MYEGQILADSFGGDHMGGYGTWGAMGFAWLMGLVIMGLIIWAVVYALRSSQKNDTPRAATSAAEATLADRFARGEIDEDEYRRRLNALRS